ncbi:nicotinamide mononucleotide transporter [Acetanaerobacterium elongatum]|uniref:Nicotinamide mononucleotide transporter n=1 Tax=Acetanaerobacterium elongatum TaxID=258515 RepID=A0A1G9Z1S7_9FIRM|nr:nicotinamide mononucleotide transporter [Acetanaerobacterium elongatum]SDN14701.1 Nicotinamide mononucleotide transporter [Acetanaerobacterium elongatum]
MNWTIIITVASLVGSVANAYKKRWCFAIWLVTNASWCIYDCTQGMYTQAILFAVNFIIALLGLINWRKAKTIKGGATDGLEKGSS